MQKAVEIQSNGLTLRGMLHVPDDIKGKIPVACIFHGFTGNKMEPHFIFVKLSRMLEKKGIASVRFDFSGSGESDGEFADMTISKELIDAKNILDYVKALDFVDKSKIGVVGLSMGGAVASMLAGDCSDEVASLCLWAPAGVMATLAIEYMNQHMAKAASANSTTDTINSTNLDHTPESFDIGGLLLGRGFVEDIVKVDIYEKASHYDKNVLILHGDKDATVPLSASEKYLEVYGTKSALHIIEGADHTFNKKVWEDEVLDFTLGFLEGELL
jgi:uncharacterized protein